MQESIFLRRKMHKCIVVHSIAHYHAFMHLYFRNILFLPFSMIKKLKFN